MQEVHECVAPKMAQERYQQQWKRTLHDPQFIGSNLGTEKAMALDQTDTEHWRKRDHGKVYGVQTPEHPHYPTPNQRGVNPGKDRGNEVVKGMGEKGHRPALELAGKDDP